ncbi:MAG TPA: HlyD family efflux transporter periplasmic adaptor subunit [Nannocystis sp.]
MKRALAQSVLVVLVLVVTGVMMRIIAALRPEVAAAPIERRMVPVTVQRAQPGAHPVTVRGLGEVKPVHQLRVMSEVGGRVVERSDRLVPGGLLRRNDLLVRLDARDVSATVASQRAALQQAAVALADERGRKSVAEYEWQGRIEALTAEAREFALRDVHVRSAEANVAAAREQFGRAKRDLGRTQVRAPFDALVTEASVELGQVISTQTALATLVAIDRYWVEIAVPVAQLVHLEIPGVNTAEERGSPARVIHDAGGGVVIEREGYVERLLGQVDARGRMARLLVAVPDPLGTGLYGHVQKATDRPASEQPRLPLLLGSSVRVEIAGQPLQETTEVPRVALVDDDKVWLVVDGKLTLRTVEVVWRSATSVLVRGLQPGDAVVTTPLATPTEGMSVTIEGESPELIAASQPRAE